MTSRLVLFGILTLLVLGGAAMAQQEIVAPLPKVSAAVKTLAQDNNQFAFDLYAQLDKQEGNLFCSPYSISSALAMTYAGAKGQTAQEMAQTLHFGMPNDQLHGAFGELTKYLNAKGTKRPYQLNVANALWGQKNYNFQPVFLDLTKTKYAAGLEEVDFAKDPEGARKIINAWVEKQTQDKIKDLIKQGVLTTDVRLVLTNAIYFKAQWAVPFFEKLTQPADFTLATGDKVKVPTMKKSEIMPYYGDNDLAIVRIPYEGNSLSMIVLLPKNANGLGALEKNLTAAQLNGLLKKLTPHQVNLHLPKFKTTSEFSLKKTLSAMGMATAFGSGADFSGMTTQNKLWISDVVHKAFVAVDEKGTEAAAATAVIMTKEAAPVVPQANFHADHPFTFAIYENQTGSILFVGRITNPNQ